MEVIIIVGALFVIALGIMPAGRGVQYGIDAIENPQRPDTPAEHDRANSDLARMLVLAVAVFALMFAWTIGG